MYKIIFMGHYNCEGNSLIQLLECKHFSHIFNLECETLLRSQVQSFHLPSLQV